MKTQVLQPFLLPSQVSNEMDKLLAWYNDQEISIDILAKMETGEPDV